MKRSVAAGTVRCPFKIFTHLPGLENKQFGKERKKKYFPIPPQVVAYYNGVRLEGGEPEGVGWEERAYRFVKHLEYSM